MKRISLFTLLAVAILLTAAIAPSYALRVYGNPSIQTDNVSPDGTYNEAYSMQTVSDKFIAKCSNRGFTTRDSNWLSLSGACSDATTWNSDAFVAIHTNASGSTATHGTMGLYYAACGTGSYAAADRSLCIKCVDNCITQFGTAGRGAMWANGYYGDCPFYGTYHLYVLANTPDTNSVLIEGLFHTNTADTTLLKTDNGKNLYAEGLYDGVCAQYGYNPHPSPDIIIDNSSGSFSCSASWATGTTTGKYGADYRWRSTAAISDAATWTPNLSSGSWTVYAWWVSGTNRSTGAPYIVTNSGGNATVYKNQQSGGAAWQTLGTWNMGSGTGFPTKLSCWAATGFVVVADAIKWHKN